MTRHYLDHASTSPLRPEAAEAVSAWIGRVVGDPGRIHAEGMAARHAVEASEARFRSLVQNSSDVTRLIARDGSIVYESPSIRRT